MLNIYIGDVCPLMLTRKKETRGLLLNLVIKNMRSVPKILIVSEGFWLVAGQDYVTTTLWLSRRIKHWRH